jgi:UDP-GlcNAc:undecaprenyl-phosphate GlcNAc-1-phosphate transferase
MLGALAMLGKYTAVNPAALLAPVLILGVPVFDTLFVMYVRWLRGIPAFLGSPDHFALRLRRWPLSVPQVAVVSYAAALLLGGVGVLSMFVSLGVAIGLIGATAILALVAALLLKRVDMSRPAEGALARERTP